MLAQSCVSINVRIGCSCCYQRNFNVVTNGILILPTEFLMLPTAQIMAFTTLLVVR